MALVKCKECGREVSGAAKICPGCGIKRPAPTNWKVIWICVGLFFVLANMNSILNSFGMRPKIGDGVASSSAPESTEKILGYLRPFGDRVVSGGNHLGCLEKERVSKIMEFYMDKDIDAVNRGAAEGIAARECVVFKKGETGNYSEASITDGLVKVRKKGSTKEYWTDMSAIKP